MSDSRQPESNRDAEVRLGIRHLFKFNWLTRTALGGMRLLDAQDDQLPCSHCTILQYTILAIFLFLFLAPVVLAVAESPLAPTLLWVDEQLLHGYAVLCILLGIAVYVPAAITTVHRRLTLRRVSIAEDVDVELDIDAPITTARYTNRMRTMTTFRSLGKCYHALLIILYVLNKDVFSTRKSAVQNAGDAGFFVLRGLQIDFIVLMGVEVLARCSAWLMRCERNREPEPGQRLQDGLSKEAQEFISLEQSLATTP